MRRRTFLVEKTLPPEYYLRVSPVAPQWVSTNTNVEYTIESNVDWIIK